MYMPRFQKGSPEAKEWAKKMREARMSKPKSSGCGVAPSKYTTIPVGAKTFKKISPPQMKKIAGGALAPPSRLPPSNPKAELGGAGLCMECDKCCGLGLLKGAGGSEDMSEIDVPVAGGDYGQLLYGALAPEEYRSVEPVSIPATTKDLSMHPNQSRAKIQERYDYVKSLSTPQLNTIISKIIKSTPSMGNLFVDKKTKAKKVMAILNWMHKVNYQQGMIGIAGLGIVGAGKRRSGNVENMTEDISQMTLEPRPQRRRINQSILNNMPIDVFKEVLRMLSYADLMSLLNTSGLTEEKKSAVEKRILYSTPPSSPINVTTPPPAPTRGRQRTTIPIQVPVFQLEDIQI